MLDIPIEQAKNALDTNVLGMLRLAQAVFPHMAARKRGTFMTIGSIVGGTVKSLKFYARTTPLTKFYIANTLGRRLLRK